MEENKVMENQTNDLSTEVEITDLTPVEEQTVDTGDSMIKGALIGAAVVGVGIGVYKGVKFIRKKVKKAVANRKAAKEEVVDLEEEIEYDYPEGDVNPSTDDTDSEG